jgi:hypothetical protein
VLAAAAKAADSAALDVLVDSDADASDAFVVLVAAEAAEEVADEAAAFCAVVAVDSEVDASDALDIAESRAASA